MWEQFQKMRKAAQEKVKKLGLDEAIRIVAKSGRFDGTANWEVEIQEEGGKKLRISCTQGAGTNGAYVRRFGKEVVLLYESLEYGQSLQCFRDGPWVDMILKTANREGLAQIAQTETKKLRRIKEEIQKFMPLD